MTITLPFQKANGLSDQGNVPGSLHVPMVYEQLPVEPVHWEYHVMIVDTREMDIPDAAHLNELGAQGWRGEWGSPTLSASELPRA